MKVRITHKDSFDKIYERRGFVSSIEDWAKKNKVNIELAVQEHTEVKSLIASEIINTEPHSILDVGCGPGFLMSRLYEEYPHGNLTGIDISQFEVENAKLNRVNGSLIISCAEHMPIRTDTFDCIVCSEVIEHVISPKIVFLEIERILKNDGSLFISTDNPLSFLRKIKDFFAKILAKKTNAKTEYLYSTNLIELIPKTIKIYALHFRCPYPILPKILILGSSTFGKLIILFSKTIINKSPSLQRWFCMKYLIFGQKRLSNSGHNRHG